MIRKIEDFLKAYGHESEGTLKYLKVLTDESLGQQVADGHWNLGKLAWHITTTVPEMMGKTGLALDVLNHETPMPATAAEIAAAYEKVTKELLGAVKVQWDDASLEVEDEMYGLTWKRGVTLGVLINHEVHHRGQMSVLMRQAGLTVPGLYGPAKEEWAKFGMEAP